MWRLDGKLDAMEKIGMFKLDLYIALITFLFPLGWSLSGFPPNIVLACVCWTISVVLLLRAFWIYERTVAIPHNWKTVITCGALLLVVGLSWSPVRAEYRKEHFTVDSDRFIATLRTQSPESRYTIRIGCPPSEEGSCVIAGHFVDYFRDAGWTVDGNSVQRAIIGRPQPGILLFTNGSGKLDPNNPHSGLWARGSQSLVTVMRAFTNVNLPIKRQVDPKMPESMIAVYFGDHPIGL
jgi:hypothetical protein